MQPLKSNPAKTLGEKFPELIHGINFDKVNLACTMRADLGAKPVVLDSIVLGARGHMTGLKLAQGESTNIVLVDADVHIGRGRDVKTQMTAQSLDQINYRKEILAQSAQGNILGLHGREGNYAVQGRAPKDRAACKGDAITSAAADAVGVLRGLATPKTSKVSIRVAVNGETPARV